MDGAALRSRKRNPLRALACIALAFRARAVRLSRKTRPMKAPMIRLHVWPDSRRPVREVAGGFDDGPRFDGCLSVCVDRDHLSQPTAKRAGPHRMFNRNKAALPHLGESCWGVMTGHPVAGKGRNMDRTTHTSARRYEIVVRGRLT